MNSSLRPQRLSSSLRRGTLRLRASWTRWWATRREHRQERLARKWQRRLLPALLPVAEAMQRLESRQREILLLLEQVALRPVSDPEEKQLLLEILQSLHPPPEQEIARSLGLPIPRR